jgi:hypothetical protein
MTHRYSTAVNNGRLDAIETVIGGTALMRMFIGAAPANCAAANSGGTIFEMPLPADWMAAAGSGAKAKNGTWSGTAIASGTVGHYRIYDQPGTTCHIQGDVSTSGAELNLDNNIVNTGQIVTISTYTITAANT